MFKANLVLLFQEGGEKVLSFPYFILFVDTEELEDPELVLDCVPREAEQKAGLGSSW